MPKFQLFSPNPDSGHEKATIQEYRQLAQVLHTFVAFVRSVENGVGEENLNLIAKYVVDVSTVDVCLILEFNERENKLSQVGISGESNANPSFTLPVEYMTRVMENSHLTILNVQRDELTQNNDFFRHERIQNVIIFPLLEEDECIGLFLANYRHSRVPSDDEIYMTRMLANLIALTLHSRQLSAKLNDMQKKVDRRLLFVWMNMLELTWRHSLIQKTSAIRNYIAVIDRLLKQTFENSSSREQISTIVGEIDRLANDINNLPPRVPGSFEMNSEEILLGPLLEEIVEKEKRATSLEVRRSVDIRAEVEALVDVKVKGYPRWLIYAIDALLQNAYHAMPNGGNVVILGDQIGSWAEIRIKDTGSGIPSEIQAKLFRGIIPKEKNEQGMGIGSLLVAIIIEEHNGIIELENPGPYDTTVLIRLPITK